MQYKAVTGSTLITGTRATLKGYSIRANTTAVINIRDGATVAGQIVVPANIAGSVSDTKDFSVPFNEGIFLELVDGTITGSVWFE
jgi:hypothetical protein